MLCRTIGALVVLFTLTCQGQNWCAPGATWSFDVYNDGGMFDPPVEGVLHARYAGDTLLSGSNAQRIDEWMHIRPVGSSAYSTLELTPLFTRVENDVVLLRRSGSDVFDTLAWFGAVPGEGWTIPEVTNGRFVVMDTAHVDVDGISLRRSIVQSYVNGFPVLSDTLYERVGFIYFHLVPSNSFLISPDGLANGLRCYQDDQISVNLVPEGDCDMTLGEEDTAMRNRPWLFPNPGTDHFTLSLPEGSHTITVHDGTGRVLKHLRTTDLLATIITDGLAAGSYLVRVDGSPVPLRWVKN
jgi:hypothetical protein